MERLALLQNVINNELSKLSCRGIDDKFDVDFVDASKMVRMIEENNKADKEIGRDVEWTWTTHLSARLVAWVLWKFVSVHGSHGDNYPMYPRSISLSISYEPQIKEGDT